MWIGTSGVATVCTAVVGSARTGPVLDAGSDREDLPTSATLTTHDSHDQNKMMTASCTLINSAESCHIATKSLCFPSSEC